MRSGGASLLISILAKGITASIALAGSPSTPEAQALIELEFSTPSVLVLSKRGALDASAIVQQRKAKPAVSERSRCGLDLTSPCGLRHGIIHGNLAPGERLRSDALASEMQVSRTPVREALRKLEAEGLVTHAGSRLVVRAIS